MSGKILHIQTEQDLRVWAKRLEIFRYVTSSGGLGDDNGDKLICLLRFKSVYELESFFKCIGFEPHVFLEPPSELKIDGANVPDIIPGTKWIQQPGHIEINGVRAYIWCTSNEITISPFEDSPTWTITEVSVRSADVIEKLLKQSSLEIIDPPVDSEYCLCPKYYPSYFC